MKSYAQNQEDLFVLNYFGDYKGTMLDIGANDGITFSNSRLLIENGWDACLLEPGCVCGDLQLLYGGGNTRVHVFNYGIGEKDEVVKFWESGSHIITGKDRGLVSTTNFEETKRWPGVEFKEREIQLVSWKNFYEYNEFTQFDFISIDAEGMEYTILQQIDLEDVACKVLCIEYNGDRSLLKLFTDYCKGYKLAIMNGENLIFVK